MNSDGSRPSTCGPITTPNTSSTTTAGTSSPRPVTSADSVPASADVVTTARKSAGSTWTAARTAGWVTPELHPRRPVGASSGPDDQGSGSDDGEVRVGWVEQTEQLAELGLM